MNKIKLASNLQLGSVSNGEGVRMVLWCQGCEIKCPSCHNKGTWSLNDGIEVDVEYIKEEIKKNKKGHSGITLSGGDPFLQPYQNIEIAKFARSLGLNVWAYCGMNFEDMIKDYDKLMLLRYIDVLVDGAYIESLKDITLPFRGSSNQRIINAPKSLVENKIILYGGERNGN